MSQRSPIVVCTLLAGAGLAAWFGQCATQRAASRDAVSPATPSTDATRPNTQTAAPATPAPHAATLAPASAAQALREVRSLVDQGKIGAARDLAEAYLKQIPDGPEAAQIQSLTGVHPHP